jgi:hypothetical protein
MTLLWIFRMVLQASKRLARIARPDTRKRAGSPQ